MKILVGVDPGLKTGVAILDRETGALQASEVDTAEYCDWVIDEMSRFDPNETLVAIERFDIMPDTYMKSRSSELWSVELIGVTRHVCRRAGIRLEVQERSAPKRFAPDEQLRACGLYQRGMGHANDAIRQLILAQARVLKEPPPWA